MRKILFATAAGLPLLLGAGIANADSIKDDLGGSMYQSQRSLPNALENTAPKFASHSPFEGRAVFVDPQALYAPGLQPSAPSYAPPLVGRDWRAGDNF